ncbi:MAG: dehydrogenase, partial [Verrucomicrobia bacterium]
MTPSDRVFKLGIWSFFGVCCLAFGVPALAADPEDPAAELASFQVADGFEVNLFAAENDGVVKPIQMRFDARGRLWVIGSTVYPQLEPGQVPNDKVLILEDTNGDGRCDKTTVFADGLMIPTGIELGDGGAYVGQGTELLFLKDTNGDDKADERRVVLRGFGTGDNHQNINSFLFGPGGELWFSQGLHIRSHVETPWGIVRLEQAGLWRLWPRRLKLEGFYGSEHEPQNPWGFVFTDWGEPIVLAGNNSSPIYPVPGLVLNRRAAAPPLIWKNGNGRKVSGGDIVGTAHFPDPWQGALIVGGYINNAV